MSTLGIPPAVQNASWLISSEGQPHSPCWVLPVFLAFNLVFLQIPVPEQRPEVGKQSCPPTKWSSVLGRDQQAPAGQTPCTSGLLLKSENTSCNASVLGRQRRKERRKETARALECQSQESLHGTVHLFSKCQPCLPYSYTIGTIYLFSSFK